MVQFAGGVTAVQLNPIALDEDAVAVSPVGAEGTARSYRCRFRVVADACVEGPEEPSASIASTT